MPEIDIDEFMDVVNETELTLCKECLFWEKLTGDCIERCCKNAPRPGINSSLDSQIQETVWPAPKANQGCFEGIAKDKVMVPTDEEMDEAVCKNNTCGASCDDCVGKCKDDEPIKLDEHTILNLDKVDKFDGVVEDGSYDNP